MLSKSAELLELGFATFRNWTSSPLLSSRVGGDACSVIFVTNIKKISKI